MKYTKLIIAFALIFIFQYAWYSMIAELIGSIFLLFFFIENSNSRLNEIGEKIALLYVVMMIFTFVSSFFSFYYEIDAMYNIFEVVALASFYIGWVTILIPLIGISRDSVQKDIKWIRVIVIIGVSIGLSLVFISSIFINSITEVGFQLFNTLGVIADGLILSSAVFARLYLQKSVEEPI